MLSWLRSSSPSESAEKSGSTSQDLPQQSIASTSSPVVSDAVAVVPASPLPPSPRPSPLPPPPPRPTRKEVNPNAPYVIFACAGVSGVTAQTCDDGLTGPFLCLRRQSGLACSSASGALASFGPRRWSSARRQRRRRKLQRQALSAERHQADLSSQAHGQAGRRPYSPRGRSLVSRRQPHSNRREAARSRPSPPPSKGQRTHSLGRHRPSLCHLRHLRSSGNLYLALGHRRPVGSHSSRPRKLA